VTSSMHRMDKRRFSASYSYSISNFVIFGFDDRKEPNKWCSIACVMENILQRGAPTRASLRLRNLMEELPALDIPRPLYRCNGNKHDWHKTIKGAPESSYNPALEFFETLLPGALPQDCQFIINYILPEVLITDIVENATDEFKNQQVDFFCPPVNLVIEIDGSQHSEPRESYQDIKRDRFLKCNGIDTLRIPTSALTAEDAANALVKRFSELPGNRFAYSCDRQVVSYELAMRLQIALVELIRAGHLDPSVEVWRIVFNCDAAGVDCKKLLDVVCQDVLDMLENLCVLTGQKFLRPLLEQIEGKDTLRIDASAVCMWSEAESEKNVIYIRNDYFEQDQFHVQCATPIYYQTNDEIRRMEIDEALGYFLKYLFGFEHFNPGQSGIIRKALTRSSTLGILPTGSGKSLCYQMACFLQPCISFVVCPIISLIQDQEANATEFGFVHSGRIDSQMSTLEKEKTMKAFGEGRMQFVWISPERFQVQAFRHELEQIASRQNYGYAVIDEAHCVSEWGHDFRVSYLKLYDTITRFCPGAAVLALTATASRNVLEDLLAELHIDRDNIQTTTSLDRPELHYRIVKIEHNRKDELDGTLDEVNMHFCQSEGVDSIFTPHGDDSVCGIIFCNVRSGSPGEPRGCEAVKARLGARSINADTYHAGRGVDRPSIQYAFIHNDFTVMAATKAFGMGINKKNVRYTIHNGLPWSIEAFYQEAGRAGRDSDPNKNESECYILYEPDPDPRHLEVLSSPKSTVEDILKIQPQLKGDLSTLFYLWCGNKEDADIEIDAIVKVFVELNHRKDAKRRVYVPKNLVWDLMQERTKERMRKRNQNKPELRITTEDALYKLAILGAVEDWTVDYKGKSYEVKLRNINKLSEEYVKNSLESYICRHKPGFSFDAPDDASRQYVDMYEVAPEGSKFPALVKILVCWTNDNIVYSRRRAICNMLELCEGKLTRGNLTDEALRIYMNDFFRLDADTLTQLDAIVDAPNLPNTWMRLFYAYGFTDDPMVQKIVLKSAKALSSIAAQCDRYRESVNANIGLEWVTMIAHLVVGSFTDNVIHEQLSFVLREAGQYGIDEEYLLDESALILASAQDDAKDAFGAAIVESAPHRALYIHERLGDNATLAYLVEQANIRLGNVWEGRTQ